MKSFWAKQQEYDFFTKSLGLAGPEKLFYITKDGKYYAYWPKKYDGSKTMDCTPCIGQKDKTLFRQGGSKLWVRKELLARSLSCR